MSRHDRTMNPVLAQTYERLAAFGIVDGWLVPAPAAEPEDLCACGEPACAWINGVGYCHACSLAPLHVALDGARITWLP